MSLVADLAPLLEEAPMRVYEPHLSEERFLDFCRRNRDLRVEQDADGNLVIMPPTFSKTGIFSGRLFRQLDEYCERTGRGYPFDSSAGFTLPNGARRSPDASWIASERWEALTEAEQDSFAPISPDLAIELLSTSDSLADGQAKMEEYMANGVRLGLLIDRKNRRVFVYRPGTEPQEMHNPSEVPADPEVPGFALRMARIF